MLTLLPAAAHAAPNAGNFRVAIDSAATTADFSKTAPRNTIVILQEYQTPLMKRLKAANPKLKVLMYKNLMGMSARQPSGFTSAGVPTQEADANPEWYLLNSSGRRFTSRNYDWIWIADVGSASYQQRWAGNVLSDIAKGGWDGVFMDDANPDMTWHYDVSKMGKYSTKAAWQAATRSALVSIGASFRAAGKLVIANFSSSKQYPAVVQDWFSLVDGGMNEQFVKWGTTSGAETYDPPADWELQLQAMKDAEAAGKYYLGISHSTPTDRAAARYGYATTLLAGEGHAQFAFHTDYTNEHWFEEYDYAIGSPAAPEAKEASGVHRRKFTNGLVLVNPTAGAVKVDFGGRYTGSGLTNASGTTLQARSGLVLTRAGDGAPFRKARQARAARKAKMARAARSDRRSRSARRAR
jgi:hypothetical protein